jgi:hypothetical protein
VGSFIIDRVALKEKQKTADSSAHGTAQKAKSTQQRAPGRS